MGRMKSSDGFKLDLGPEEPEAVYKEQVDELRIEKLSQRITLISVLIPLMIVVILAVAYLDIKKRVVRTQYTGTSSVQSLSKELESRFSSLSLRQAKLEARMEAIEKSNASLQVALDKTARRLARLRKTTAAAKTVARLDSRVKALQASLKSVQDDIAAATARTAADLDSIRQQTATMEQRITAIADTLETLDKNRLSKDDVNLAVRLEALKTKQLLQAEIDRLAVKLEGLQKNISALKKRIKAMPAFSKPTQGGKKSASKTTGNKKPSPAAGAPASGAPKIVEQDIKQ